MHRDSPYHDGIAQKSRAHVEADELSRFEPVWHTDGSSERCRLQLDAGANVGGLTKALSGFCPHRERVSGLVTHDVPLASWLIGWNAGAKRAR